MESSCGPRGVRLVAVNVLRSSLVNWQNRMSPHRMVQTPKDNPRSQIRRYFAELDPGARRVLRRIRDDIRAAAPDAVDAFSYRIPGFRLDGRALVWYAAWARHVSLYPITTAIQRKYAVLLGAYETSKGTVRFPLASPLPSALVRTLVKARVAEVRAAKGRASARTSRSE